MILKEQNRLLKTKLLGNFSKKLSIFQETKASLKNDEKKFEYGNKKKGVSREYFEWL